MMHMENYLICECHLVDFEELKALIQQDKGLKLKKVEDLKLNRIIGHGCGQCLKTWEHELEQLLLEIDLSLRVDF